MRILYIHQYYCPPGGSGNNRSRDFARIWAKEGAEVTILTSFAYFPADMRAGIAVGEIREFTFEGVRVIAIHIPYNHLLSFGKRIRAFIQFYRAARKYLKSAFSYNSFQLIYASSTPPTIGELGRKFSRRWNIPYIFETVDVWPDVPAGMGIIRNKTLLSWLNRRLDRIYSEASLIIALSEGMRDQVLSHGNWTRKTIVIHNGVDVDAFMPVEHRNAADFHAIYAGTVGIANGLNHLVGACAILQKAGHSNIQITVLGSGNDLSRVKALATQYELKNLHFEDQVPKEVVGDYFAKSDAGIVCFANYSVLEANSANKLFDYLASGLPVVTNYQGWQATYLREFRAGISCPQGEDQAFADAILKMAQLSSAERKAMGDRGRAMVLQYFDRNRLALDLLAKLQLVLDHHQS